MTDKREAAPVAEQELCVGCGFCCDGTLFRYAELQKEELPRVPEKIIKALFIEKEEDYFRLPCGYFSSKCTIYDETRPSVCGIFRCQLLKDFAAGKVDFDEARRIIADAAQMRKRLLEKHSRITGRDDAICFRDLLEELGHIEKKLEGNEHERDAYDMLQAECNIFEALIIKHIRSEADFEKMKTGEER